jgi:hypothetical protein
MERLDALIERLKELIDLATDGLIADLSRHAEYQEIMAELLARYHTAAYLVGAGTDTVSDAAREKIVGGVASQLAFLERFVTEIQGAEAFEAGWQARARSYAESVKVPYWHGKTKLLPLVMPAEGTDCQNNCKCLWDIKKIGDDSYSCTWVRHADDSCATCIERGQEWRNLKVIDGVLQT